VGTKAADGKLGESMIFFLAARKKKKGSALKGENLYYCPFKEVSMNTKRGLGREPQAKKS